MGKHLSQKVNVILPSVFIIICIVFYFFIIRPQQDYYYAHYVKINGIYLLKPLEISNFELIDNHSTTFTKNNLKGHWTLLFFGFTHCSVVCPTTMARLNETYKILEKTLPNKQLPQIVFISIDPDHDSIDRLNQYVASFNPHFISAKTTIEKTAALEKQFHATSTKILEENQEPNLDTITHSSEIILVNPEANIQAYFYYPPQSDRLAEDYHAILKKNRN